MRFILGILFLALTTQAGAHSGGLDKQGCYAGSKPYHCHKAQKSAPAAEADPKTVSELLLMSETAIRLRWMGLLFGWLL